MIGGGNFWRGRTSETIDRNKADQIGMLATIMNCIYVSDLCRYTGMKTEIYTPFACGAFTKLYSKDSVEESFAQGKLVFFAGGTGHPYFSTDTATVLRAVIMCLEQKMPMMVFALDEENSIINTVHGKFSGTKVTV